jgi:hypothetical protein
VYPKKAKTARIGQEKILPHRQSGGTAKQQERGIRRVSTSGRCYSSIVVGSPRKLLLRCSLSLRPSPSSSFFSSHQTKRRAKAKGDNTSKLNCALCSTVPILQIARIYIARGRKECNARWSDRAPSPTCNLFLKTEAFFFY